MQMRINDKGVTVTISIKCGSINELYQASQKVGDSICRIIRTTAAEILPPDSNPFESQAAQNDGPVRAILTDFNTLIKKGYLAEGKHFSRTKGEFRLAIGDVWPIYDRYLRSTGSKPMLSLSDFKKAVALDPLFLYARVAYVGHKNRRAIVLDERDLHKFWNPQPEPTTEPDEFDFSDFNL